MTGDSKSDRLLSRGNEIAELRDLKQEFQEELGDKNACGDWNLCGCNGTVCCACKFCR